MTSKTFQCSFLFLACNVNKYTTASFMERKPISWTVNQRINWKSLFTSKNLLSDRRVPAELGQESQASSCLRKGTPLASRVAQGGLSPPVELCVDREPLRIQGYCGVGRGLSGHH